MDNKLDKLDELVDLAKKLINDQKELNEQNKEIVLEIDYLYKRLNENNDIYLDERLISSYVCNEEY